MKENHLYLPLMASETDTVNAEQEKLQGEFIVKMSLKANNGNAHERR